MRLYLEILGLNLNTQFPRNRLNRYKMKKQSFNIQLDCIMISIFYDYDINIINETRRM